MLTRRKTLQIIGSAFLYSPFHSLFAGGLPTKKASCAACQLKASAQMAVNPLYAAPYLSTMSQVALILPASRSPGGGYNVNHVQTSTGQVAIRMQDLKIDCTPSIQLQRYYNSGVKTDVGFGAGWTMEFDDSVAIEGKSARLLGGNGTRWDLVWNPSLGRFETADQTLFLQANTAGDYMESSLRSFPRTYRKFGGVFRLVEISCGRLGNITIERASAGRITRIQHGQSGAYLELSWSHDGHLASVSDHSGRTVSYDYTRQNLVAIHEVCAGLVRLDYRAIQLTSVKDAEGRAVLAADYANGRCRHMQTAQGECTYSYSAQDGSATTSIDFLGWQKFDVDHHPDGSVKQVRQGSDAIHIASVEPSSSVRAPDVRGSAARISRNRMGRVLTLRDGPIQRHYRYDERGWLVAAWSKHISMRCVRNLAGQVIAFRQRGLAFSLERDRAGAITEVTASNGRWARANRDTAGRIVEITNSEGQRRQFTYDAIGRVQHFIDAQGRHFEFEYSPMEQRASKMRQLDGGLQFQHPSQALALGVSNENAADFSDGWRDPLNALGLLGALSGNVILAGAESKTNRATAVTGGLGNALNAPQANVVMAPGTGGVTEDEGIFEGGDPSSDEDEPGGYDSGGSIEEVPPDMPEDDPDPSDPEEEEDPEASQPSQSTPCQACYDDWQAVCQNSYDVAVQGATRTEYWGMAACTPLAVSLPAYFICMGTVAGAWQSGFETAQANYANCVRLIRQNCYNRCS